MSQFHTHVGAIPSCFGDIGLFKLWTRRSTRALLYNGWMNSLDTWYLFDSSLIPRRVPRNILGMVGIVNAEVMHSRKCLKDTVWITDISWGTEQLEAGEVSVEHAKRLLDAHTD